MPAHPVGVRRVYEPPAPSDGQRILVDRLWPRGMAKQEAPFDRWMKDVAPSAELRRWYGHDHDRFDEFRRRYLDELRDDEQRSFVTELVELRRHGRLTLLTATKDVEHAHAVVLADELRRLR